MWIIEWEVSSRLNKRRRIRCDRRTSRGGWGWNRLRIKSLRRHSRPLVLGQLSLNMERLDPQSRDTYSCKRMGSGCVGRTLVQPLLKAAAVSWLKRLQTLVRGETRRSLRGLGQSQSCRRRCHLPSIRRREHSTLKLPTSKISSCSWLT